jgi:hypothetical protein
MKKVFTLLFVLMLAAMTGIAWAEAISESQARSIATEFMSRRAMPSVRLSMARKAPRLSVPDGSQAAYYVFNAQRGNGYVIVAGDDRVPAVLGYSDQGNFDAEDVPPTMQEWLDGYAAQIEAIANGCAPDERGASHAAIEPMLNVKWGQGMPYSVLLPHINGSSNAHAYVGCVAVAMAQIMAYWQYPSRPTTTIPGYTSSSGKPYAVTMPSLAPMDFDWENMHETYYTNDSTSEACMAVAHLMLYSTTAMQSNFGQTSTGSLTRKIPEKLITYFGYKNSAHYLYREYYSTQAWEDTIYAELAAGRPVAYGGNKQSAGHAFVCDGYDGDGRFHINWGWAGKSNGYFLLNLLNPSEEGIGSAAGAYGYVKGQGIGIGIEPANHGSESGTAAFTFDDLAINSYNSTRSSASSNFSVTVSGKFVNNTNVTSQFRQGWGLYNSDGELVDVLYIRYSTSALSNGDYITVSSRPLNFGAGITSGTYRILPIYSIYPSEDYRPCIGSDVNYIEVIFNGTYGCTIKGYGTAGSNTSYNVNSCTTEGTLNHGKPVTVTLNLTNRGTSSNDLIYMFVDGEFNAMGLANIGAGETGDIVYRFTPETPGTKTLTFSLNENGTPTLFTQRVTINTMPSATLDVSYRILNITDEDNRIITADHYSIIADVKNTGTTDYNEDFSVRLYRINNDETNTGTELLNQTQPLQLAAGDSTSLQFDFDRDLIDGWKYFCYLYYYSAGATVGKGTKWYQLIFPTEPVQTYGVTAVSMPAEGGAITFTGGVTEGQAQGGKTVSFTVEAAEGYVFNHVEAHTQGDENIELSHNATTGRYSFVMPTEEVTVTAYFDAVHSISASAEQAIGGSYSVSQSQGKAGDIITVSAVPNVGWQCDGITVTDGTGNDVAVTDEGGNFTFVMPDADVIVTVSFSRSTGNLFELVESRADITEGDIYVLVSSTHNKVMKRWSEGDATFQADDVASWADEGKTRVRVSDDACFFTLTEVADTTISGNTRTAAYLKTGNGILRTSNYNLMLQDNTVAESRAWMYIGNALNCLIRFKDTTSGSNGNWVVRYDPDSDVFKVMNWNVTGAETSRVWLYKLVDEPTVMKGDVNGDNQVNITDIIKLINAISSNNFDEINIDAADVNGDDQVNITDVIQLINYVSNGHW